ncbi:autotransporter outer membrane beta-barrel domain-containing protein [Pantoea ananatis]|uniref:autotransporter outer membrane beta-barrel domain-containing protein n=1 Tax=Pantoea ananas TaxID=553 RepID=UPI0024ADB75A|nr:autotransporter serine protease [Pantoea ananatis]MDI6539561.1 autotransporter outer membrane beta-barrel domain-containing protein [Pantoea ananatis]
MASGSIYKEASRPGVPSSWMTPEFNHQWGLEAINAQYAYARGYNGHGVNIGILDAPLFQHPEFTGKLTLVSGAQPYDYDIDEDTGNIFFESHGTHVAGIAAASRNGSGMHGVAYGATLTTGSIPDKINQLEYMIQSNVRVINNSWGDAVPVEQDASGNDILLPNGTWKYEQTTLSSLIDALEPLKERINAFSQHPVPPTVGDENLDIAGLAGMLRAARHGKLIVFATGNTNNYNVPTRDETLPYLFPGVLDRYLTVANLTSSDDLDKTSTSCGHTASYCVSAPGTDIYSASGRFVSPSGAPVTEESLNRGELKVVPDYEVMTGTSMAAPHVSGAVAVLMQRFPYMTAEQISAVLKTTATDLGKPGIDERFGWGKINLKDAIDGPKMFIAPADIPPEFYVPGSYTNTQFVADIPGINALLDAGTPLERQCTGQECAVDVWRNDITGHGGLTKEGRGMLILSGTSTYAGPTLVNQGRLAVNGSVTSDVSVQRGGLLGGSGTVGSLTVRRGGTVAPGNSVGSLNVTRNVSFDPGSLFTVEVGRNGQSDRIQSSGLATIDGGQVAVMLENSSNLLTQREVRSLLGQQYNILSAKQGVNGQFDSVAPNYLFLGTGLSYQPNGVILNVGRNSTRFASVAQTPNQRSVAVAADELKAGHPVYESILSSNTADDARQAFRQLSGQIHADISSALLNGSLYLRDALNDRLRQAQGLTGSSTIKTDNSGAWGQLLGTWGHASGDANATGYQLSDRGVFLGLDSATDNGRVGVATGFTRTALKGGFSSKADSDNYHLATYGDKQYGALALRSGAGYTWHRIETSRLLNFGGQSDRDTAKYNARTGQLFLEAGYNVQDKWLNLEPFGNVAYINFSNRGIAESGDGAALRGDKQTTDITLSTLGIRADSEWQISQKTTVALRSELGWQHQYGSLDRGSGLKFYNGNTPFVVNSVPASRDGMVLKASAEVEMNKNAILSLGYGGLMSPNYQDNSINAGFTWRF